MTPVSRLSLLVEVNVQENFLTDFPPENSTSPISPQTWNSWFKQWLEVLSVDVSVPQGYELTLRLTNDAQIQLLNAQYRHRDQPTDVLSFAALEVNIPQTPPELIFTEPLYLGDILISVDTAWRQAQTQGHSFTRELAWLATHGLLHLLGWDHPDEASLASMLAQQETLLQLVGQ